MRPESCLEAIFATLLTGFVAVAVVLMSSVPGSAEPLTLANKNSSKAATKSLTRSDKLAALENVQYALSELGDGASYVWHRHHGKLSGVIQPTMSFLDGKRRVCRHIIVLLSAGSKSRKTEAVACRKPNGVWRLDG